jgi:hypothetical protein
MKFLQVEFDNMNSLPPDNTAARASSSGVLILRRNQNEVGIREEA